MGAMPPGSVPPHLLRDTVIALDGDSSCLSSLGSLWTSDTAGGGLQHPPLVVTVGDEGLGRSAIAFAALDHGEPSSPGTSSRPWPTNDDSVIGSSRGGRGLRAATVPVEDSTLDDEDPTLMPWLWSTTGNASASPNPAEDLLLTIDGERMTTGEVPPGGGGTTVAGLRPPTLSPGALNPEDLMLKIEVRAGWMGIGATRGSQGTHSRP